MRSLALSTNQTAVRSIGAIEQRSPFALKPWPNNPRTHGDAQIAKLAASIGVFGFTIPALIDEAGTVLSGHARVEAAKRLALNAIPVRCVHGWSESDKRLYVIADNKLSLLSSWDPLLLKSEFELLFEDDVEIELTAFDTAEIDVLFTEDVGDADDLQEMPTVAPVTRLGDLWHLGEHRLLCADSLRPDAY